MSGNKAYRIIEEDGKGLIISASKDLLPGTLVLKEDKPLLKLPEVVLRKLDKWNKNVSVSMAAYNVFKKTLQEREKKMFCELFGPTDGVFGQQMAAFPAELNVSMGDDEPLTITPEELSTFIKVASVWRYNAFNVQEHGYKAVFALATRISHSCAPNCYLDFVEPHGCVLRAIVPIKKDDELTIEYNSTRSLMPIHRRRHEYAEMKEFTCHCPRCDAEGDDTREFDCFDPICSGSHLVCQPLSKEPIQFDAHTYTGVEYVEPHLLPCTVCHRAPPPQYQEDMFALEKELPAMFIEAELAYEMLDQTSLIACEKLYKHLCAVQLPRYHSAALGPMMYKILVAKALFKLTGDSKALVECTLQHLRCYERPSLSPCKQLVSALHVGAVNLYQSKDVTQLSRILGLCRRVLCMHKLMHGRDHRPAELTVQSASNTLVQVLQQLPPQPATTTECMFCGESPLRAAVTLSRCGRCRQVTYCSAGCQKAHWPLHKKECCKKG